MSGVIQTHLIHRLHSRQKIITHGLLPTNIKFKKTPKDDNIGLDSSRRSVTSNTALNSSNSKRMSSGGGSLHERALSRSSTMHSPLARSGTFVGLTRSGTMSVSPNYGAGLSRTSTMESRRKKQDRAEGVQDVICIIVYTVCF